MCYSSPKKNIFTVLSIASGTGQTKIKILKQITYSLYRNRAHSKTEEKNYYYDLNLNRE